MPGGGNMRGRGVCVAGVVRGGGRGACMVTV